MTPQIIIMTPELLKEFARAVIDEYRQNVEPQITYANNPNEEVNGIRGICNIFGVSISTANVYKREFLLPGGATTQRGRIIRTNVAKAKQLFNEYKAKKK